MTESALSTSILSRARGVPHLLTHLLYGALALGLGCVVSLTGCTDAKLYHQVKPPIAADRLTLTGRVCTEDPEVQNFPVRLILLVDQSQGPLYSDFDPAQERLKVLNEIIQGALSRPEYSVAMIGYSGRAQRLAPLEGDFTRNPAELFNGVTQLTLPGRCLGAEVCRDYQSGLKSINALISDDLASMEPGVRAVTQYTILWMGSGRSEPLARNRDCCAPADRTCRSADLADQSSYTCQAELDIDLIQTIRADTLAQGAGGFQLHMIHLTAESDPDINRRMAQVFEQVAFAGGGRYARFGSANNIDPRSVLIFDRPSDLEAAQILITNRSAAPRAGGLAPDSDRDGLSDEEELSGDTDPTLADTDDDGISDLIEARVGFSVEVRERPSVCEDLSVETWRSDRDLDGMNECEERLMGTDPSLMDSDGDNLPDGVELHRGTDHLNADSAKDFDEDGISNGDEILEGTDPRSVDDSQRLGLAARYAIEREGRVRELNPDPLFQLEGVRVISVSPLLSPGVGSIQWAPGRGEAPTMGGAEVDSDEPSTPPLGVLRFQAPSQSGLGVDVEVTASGRYRLYSEADRPQMMGPRGGETGEGDALQGISQEAEELEGEWVELEIEAGLLPEVQFTEPLVVRERVRSCLTYTVRNLRLIETLPLERDLAQGLGEGENELLIYFAQKTLGQSEAPGRFRVARIPIRYRAPSYRAPAGASIEVEPSEFVSPSVRALTEQSAP